jgi:CubicO group peptidase (beta-lactamase class C family)
VLFSAIPFRGYYEPLPTNKKMNYPLILAFLIINFSLFAQHDINSVMPEKVGLSSDSLKKMNNHFHKLVDNNKLPGIQTAVMRHGQLVHFDSYGYADIKNKKVLDTESIFRIFSMTKPIVSVALMQLYEQGKFKLDDPVAKYIPQLDSVFVYSDSTITLAKRPITIRQLLTHTAGYGNGRSSYPKLNQLYRKANLFNSKNNKEFVEALSKIPLQFEPGTNWQYGHSTAICGYLIEVLSGKNLNIYLKEELFLPLGMNNTFFQVPLEKINNFTVGYRWNKTQGITVLDTPKNSRYTKNMTMYHAGGGLVSTTLDYLRFCQMLLNKGTLNHTQILKQETVDLMLQDHIQETRKHQPNLKIRTGESGFGLGFVISGSTPDTLEKVFGWGGLAGTYFKIDVENNLIYILMVQLRPHSQLKLRSTFQNFIKSALID